MFFLLLSYILEQLILSESFLTKEHVFKVKLRVIQQEIQEPLISIIGCWMFLSFC